MFRNIEVSRRKLENGTRCLENIRINEKVNNREKEGTSCGTNEFGYNYELFKSIPDC